jgi:hypothetical protein
LFIREIKSVVANKLIAIARMVVGLWSVRIAQSAVRTSCLNCLLPTMHAGQSYTASQ